MRNDDPNPGLGKSPEGVHDPAKPAFGLAWTGFLYALVAATSLALASVSVWLVGPYLALMVWLLFDPARHRLEPTGSVKHEPSNSSRTKPATNRADSPRPEENTPSEPEPLQEVSQPPSDEDPPKPRRARSRRRRAAKAATPPPEPVSVTWVQVGPGQFVRVEESQPSSDQGPQSSDAPANEGEAPSSESQTVQTLEPEPLASAQPSALDTRSNPDPDSSSEPTQEPESSASEPEPEPEGVPADPTSSPQDGVLEPVPVETPTDLEPEPEPLEAAVVSNTVADSEIEAPPQVVAPGFEPGPQPPEEVAPPSSDSTGSPEEEESEMPLAPPEVELNAELAETPPIAESSAQTEPGATSPEPADPNPGPTPDVPEPGPAFEPESPVEPTDATAFESQTIEVEGALADHEVGEGDLPQAGLPDDAGTEFEGDSPENPAPVFQQPEFDGESQLPFEPADASLSPTRTRVPNRPGWLPRARSLFTRVNVRAPEPAVARPSRVRSVPRQANRPRRHRSWHGSLHHEPRAPPNSRIRRPSGLRRSVRSIHPLGAFAPNADQAA